MASRAYLSCRLFFQPCLPILGGVPSLSFGDVDMGGFQGNLSVLSKIDTRELLDTHGTYKLDRYTWTIATVQRFKRTYLYRYLITSRLQCWVLG